MSFDLIGCVCMHIWVNAGGGGLELEKDGVPCPSLNQVLSVADWCDYRLGVGVAENLN